MSVPDQLGDEAAKQRKERKETIVGLAMLATIILVVAAVVQSCNSTPPPPNHVAAAKPASSAPAPSVVPVQKSPQTSMADGIKALSRDIEKVEVDRVAPPIVNVTFKAPSVSGSDSMMLLGYNANEVLGEAVKKGVLPKDYAISFLSQAHLADQLGNGMDLPVMRLELSAEMLAKINFHSGEFSGANLMNVAQVDYIHKAVRDDVVDFCNKYMDKGYKLFCLHAAVYLHKEGYVIAD